MNIAPSMRSNTSRPVLQMPGNPTVNASTMPFVLPKGNGLRNMSMLFR
jgi:hypothetical protein